MVSVFAIPENICLLLYQEEEQETGRPTAAKGFKMALDEFTKGIIWRSCWWSQETRLDKAASLFKSDFPKRCFLFQKRKERRKKEGLDGSLLWWRPVSLVRFRDEHVKKETVEKTLEAPGMH